MHIDSLPEWSKGVDSSSTSASCVGSNPIAVRPAWGMQPHASRSRKHMHTSGCQGVRRCLRGESWLSARNPRHLAQVVQGGGLKFHLRRAAWAQALPARKILIPSQEPTTVCPSGLRGWTQVPLAQAAWVQIPQLSGQLGACSRMLLGAATTCTHLAARG